MASNSLQFNARIGIQQNLPTGATYDLLLMSFPDGFPQSQLIFGIDTEPRKITGIQKCAQIFLKILFTTRGSDVFYPNVGTLFQTYTINANRIDADPTLRADLITEINSATKQAQAILNSSGDPASQIASVTMLGIDVGDESIVIYLNMTTNAGVTASIAVPFPELDLPLTPAQ